MRRIIFSLLLIASLFHISGCVTDGVRDSLLDVESYIMERPDSALAVLDSMDRTLLTTDRLKAHHALLHAMALDKNYIDVDDDSIARVAVDYFSKHGPKKYEARARYYLGVSYYYAGDFDKAILEFTECEKVAEKSDSLYLAMAIDFQANTYLESHNYEEELECRQEAYKIYSLLSADFYMKATELDIARVYLNTDDPEKGEVILYKFTSDDNPHIRASAMVSYAFVKATRGEAGYSESADMYEAVVSEFGYSCLSYKDYWAWAYSLNKLGRNEEAADMISQLQQVDTSGTADFWMYMIEKSNGNTAGALKCLEKSTTKLDKEMMKALQESLALSQRDYYASQFEVAEYKSRNKSLYLVVSISVLLLIILLISWSSSRHIRHQREEKEYYLKYADEIRRQLEASRNDNYPELKKKYIDLYRSRFELIGSLYEQYALFEGKKNAERAMYERVSAMIAEFRSDYENKEKFESMLNDYHDGVISNLRKELPELKEMDYTIFGFMLIGFDATTISLLLNISMNAVYIRKSRMRNLIKEKTPAHMEQFLEVLH